jgi:hypothetical protein
MTPQKLTTATPLETTSFSPTLVVTPSSIVATLKKQLPLITCHQLHHQNNLSFIKRSFPLVHCFPFGLAFIYVYVVTCISQYEIVIFFLTMCSFEITPAHSSTPTFDTS